MINQRDNYEHFTQDTVKEWLKGFYKQALCVDEYVNKVVSLENPVTTVKFFGALYGFSILAEYICMCCVLWFCNDL